MSNVKVTNLLHGSSASNNITLASDGTTTIPTVKATTQVLVGGVSSTANGGTLQISNGITFPATQSACSDANTLDDYEEGTWTPELADASSGGNLFTHSVQNGLYTKVGNVVTVYFRITWTSKGSASAGNYVFIRGYPFASKSNNGGYYYTGAIVPRNGQITVVIEGGQSRGLFIDSSGGYGVVSEFSASDTNEGMNGCFTYLAS